jgi:hypothetical protein
MLATTERWRQTPRTKQFRGKSPNRIDPTDTVKRFPTDDTIRNLFRKFGMGQVQRFFEPLAEWQMQRLPQRPSHLNHLSA